MNGETPGRGITHAPGMILKISKEILPVRWCIYEGKEVLIVVL